VYVFPKVGMHLPDSASRPERASRQRGIASRLGRARKQASSNAPPAWSQRQTTDRQDVPASKHAGHEPNVLPRRRLLSVFDAGQMQKGVLSKPDPDSLCPVASILIERRSARSESSPERVSWRSNRDAAGHPPNFDAIDKCEQR
jgi:hypothetical protein